MSHSAADLTAAREPLAPPEGLRVATYDALDPRQLYDAEVQVRDDDPSGLSGGPAYEEWVRTSWDNPDIRYDLSIAVLDGDQVLSFVTTTADPDRQVIWSNLTGTIPSARGRGLVIGYLVSGPAFMDWGVAGGLFAVAIAGEGFRFWLRRNRAKKRDSSSV